MASKNLFSKRLNQKYWQGISALGFIILAVVLIEAITFAQQHYIRNIVKEELAYRAESELNLKAHRLRGVLKSNEKLIKNYKWYIEQNLNNPEALYSVTRHIVENNRSLMSCFVAFKPGYFNSSDGLFEPCSMRRGDSIITKQLGGPGHDYTLKNFYRSAVEDSTSLWSDPYTDPDVRGQKVTTYSTPITDASGNVVAAFGIDLSTIDIIDTINTQHDYPSTFYLLLTEDGELISKPSAKHNKYNNVMQVVDLINDSTVVQEPSSSGKGMVITFKEKTDNALGYIFHGHLHGQPHWQIAMVCYDEEVYSKLYDLRRYSMLTLLAGFSLLGLILYLFGRNLKKLHQSSINQERTDSELRVAKNIQSDMLPHNSISRPDVDIKGMQLTALEVGGDLYDYFVHDEKLYFCIGDVSGKGVPSSLVMAVVHSHFRILTRHESNPTRIMQAINDAACEGNEINMFVTLFIGVLDLPTGRLRYCNAGHDAPLLINDDVTPLNVKANMPVGLFNDFKYVQQQEQVPNGTTIFLYTDGLTEANDPSHKLFGLQRIIDTAQQCRNQGHTSPDQIMEAMNDAVQRYANGAQQSDDLTMLTLQYHQPQEKVLLNETITLTNDLQEVPKLNEFVKSVTKRLNLDTSMSSQLMLAVEESVVNVMNYAYPIGTQGDIDITAHSSEKSLKFIITDQGKAFDPTHTREADTTLSAEERPIGGLGILLVQKLMDTINYERIDGKNVLTLKKDINNKQ